MRYKLDVTVSFRFLKSVAFYLVLWYNSLKIEDFETLEEIVFGAPPLLLLHRNTILQICATFVVY